MLSKSLGLIAVLGLSACATSRPEPRIVTQTVSVPVRVSCVPPTVPEAPTSWPDDNLPKAPEAAAERYRLVAAANELRKAWIALAAPAIRACR